MNQIDLYDPQLQFYWLTTPPAIFTHSLFLFVLNFPTASLIFSTLLLGLLILPNSVLVIITSTITHLSYQIYYTVYADHFLSLSTLLFLSLLTFQLFIVLYIQHIFVLDLVFFIPHPTSIRSQNWTPGLQNYFCNFRNFLSTLQIPRALCSLGGYLASYYRERL